MRSSIGNFQTAPQAPAASATDKLAEAATQIRKMRGLASPELPPSTKALAKRRQSRISLARTSDAEAAAPARACVEMADLSRLSALSAIKFDAGIAHGSQGALTPSASVFDLGVLEQARRTHPVRARFERSRRRGFSSPKLWSTAQNGATLSALPEGEPAQAGPPMGFLQCSHQ
ncbi:hypothetical protein [Sphingopyxis panaciterrulae]|uniref:Uncharacterized protein n=1 Tax=Sphingopyxis panaciterrulae TaxID=462372 RepID=A0A7W9B7E6_9SPHN|nr:hypothetical protein [Sphingopyxis panaciterrulae]MBB5707597.1 hypothetical protein [Sphingopyxis panaciterrulae]